MVLVGLAVAVAVNSETGSGSRPAPVIRPSSADRFLFCRGSARAPVSIVFFLHPPLRIMFHSLGLEQLESLSPAASPVASTCPGSYELRIAHSGPPECSLSAGQPSFASGPVDIRPFSRRKGCQIHHGWSPGPCSPQRLPCVCIVIITQSVPLSPNEFSVLSPSATQCFWSCRGDCMLLLPKVSTRVSSCSHKGRHSC